MAKPTSDNKRRSQSAQNREGSRSKPSSNTSTSQGVQTPNKQGIQASSKQSTQTLNKPSAQTPSKQGVQTPSKPSTQTPSKPSTQAQNRQPASRAAQRVAKHQQKQQDLESAKRARRITLFSVLGVVIIGAALIAGIIYYNNTHPQAITPVNAAYPAVDGVSCEASEQSVYHIHVHVSVWINGQNNPIPQNVGIASNGSCLYWLHTHDTTGVIHIESPTQKDYSLGNFFDEWSQRFSSLGYPPELDSASGWQVWINGKPYTGDFHNITLTAHELITMAYNSPNVKPVTTYAWNGL